jgi:hypothetical protein
VGRPKAVARRNDRDLDLLVRMDVELVYFENVIPLPIDELAKNLVLRRWAFPSPEGGACQALYNRVGAVDLVQHVPDRADESERRDPMNVPTLKVRLFFEQLQHHAAIVEDFKPQQMRFLLSIKTVFPKPGGKVWVR